MAPITLITAPPVFMPLEQFAEFQASTPASGNFNHEPVLHHLEKNALLAVDPGVEGFDHTRNARGDLYVTEATLAFFNPDTQAGFSVPYPTITLHATSRHTPPVPTSSSVGTAESQACVYCQLDEAEPEDWDDIAEEDMPETREMYIFPSDPSAVQDIYSALSRCASLHPSTDNDNSTPALDLGSLVTGNEEELEGDGVTPQEGENSILQEGTAATDGAAGRAQRERLENLIDWNGFEPNGSARRSAEEDEANMQDADEGD